MKPLQPGDEIRVVATSLAGRWERKSLRNAGRAQQRLEQLGFKVTFGRHVRKQGSFGTAPAQDRLEDLHAAYADPNVRAVLAQNGGWLANELLPGLDWRLIAANTKPLIGYSDNTVLLNAIYAKTGAPGLLGPNFDTLGRMNSWQFTLAGLDAILRKQLPARLARSQTWSTAPGQRFKTKPWNVLQPGEAEAVMLGGNIGTFYLLQGTPYQPEFSRPFILLAEDDDESGKFTAPEFSRRLESILQLPGVRENLRGLVIGRFQPSSSVRMSDLAAIVASKRLKSLPVVAGVDFGHSLPMLTLPIGGRLKLTAGKRAELTVVDY